MFRTLRARAGLFRLSRVPLTVRARIQGDGGAASVQGVRFKKRAMRPKYLLGSTIGVLLLYNIFTRTVLTPLDELAEELEKEESETDSDMTENLDDSLFIPFPGTIRRIPQTGFRGSDPEWKAYVKFHKDQTLKKEVKYELAEIARRELAAVSWGKGARIVKYWLSFDYPYSPPPTFVHSGIEITDDFISWSTVPIDQVTVRRIQQAFYPVAVAKATWKWLQVLFSQDPEQTARSIIRVAYNLPDPAEVRKTYDALVSSDKQAPEEKITQARVGGGGIGVTSQTRNYNHPTAQQVRESAGKQPDHIGEKTLHTQSDAESVTKNVSNQDSRDQDGHVVKKVKDTQIYKELSTRYSYASTAWKCVTTVNWKPVKVIPRGNIVVSGMVELELPLDLVVMDVFAVWDPKTRAFDTTNSSLVIRKRQRKQQKPLPG